MCTPNWLPEIICLEDYGGNWEEYLEVLYRVFKEDFLDSTPLFIGMRIGIKKYPLLKDKETAFWHIVQDGEIEVDRLPNLRRCERVPWPRPIIEHYPDDAVKFWKNERRGNTRLLLWLWESDFLVVLEDRGSYFLLITAYPVANEHYKIKLEKEREEYWASLKASAAPKDGTDTFSTHGR